MTGEPTVERDPMKEARKVHEGFKPETGVEVRPKPNPGQARPADAQAAHTLEEQRPAERGPHVRRPS